MTLTKVKLERFTVFADLTADFSPGINAFIGVNGTGKTHPMKVCYAACDVSKTGRSFSENLARLFLPSRGRFYRLIKQQAASATTDKDKVAFHSLYRDESGEIACHTSGSYLDIRPNAIAETFTSLPLRPGN